MITAWKKVLNDGETLESLEKILKGNSPAIDRLRQLWYNIIKDIQRERLSDSQFDSPGWALRQANYNGRIKQLEELISLTDFIYEAPDKGTSNKRKTRA